MVLEQNPCSVFLESLNSIVHPYLLRYKTSTDRLQEMIHHQFRICFFSFVISITLGQIKKKGKT